MRHNGTCPAQDKLYTDEKIDYTRYLRDKPLETDPAKLAFMEAAAARALESRGVIGQTQCVCYADGRVMVKVGGEYYNMFDVNTGRFLSGGDSDGR